MTESDNTSSATAPPAGFYPDGAGRSRFWDGSQWTEHYQDATPTSDGPGHGTPAPTPKKKRRVFFWFFLAVQVLFIVWIIAGISGGSGTPDDCGSLDVDTCNDAEDIGTGIGVFLVFIFWVIVDFLLAVTYGIYRLAKRS